MKITSIKTLVALCALHNTRAAFLSEGTSLGERAFAVGQSVQTSSGLVTGQAASNRTQVSEYLGIPFAQPPTGILRFAAPEKFSGSGKIQATTFSPDCPANTGAQSLAAIPGYIVTPQAIRLLAETAQVGDTFSEDCLTLNIWAKPQTGEKSKAVLFWIYGGGFATGNTNNPAYNGQYFADNQDVIVVSANYRVNIFGFPGLPGMPQNLGLLDQRLAIEWVRDNIAAFGGDPTRITIFGQSAGGASVDYYSYAWVSDPIVEGFIPESGTATSFNQPLSTNNTVAWYNTTEKLSCGGPSAGIAATVACMRTKTFEDILAASVPPPGLASVTGLFPPTIDDTVVFSDYPTRALAGNFIKKPYLAGNNDYEAGLFKIIAAASGTFLPNIDWAIFNLADFTCPAANAAAFRVFHGVSTWRYRYFANFPNLRLTSTPDSGAYHGAEIATVWATAEDASGLADTVPEAAISSYLQSAWAAFAKAPSTALSAPPYSWPKYNPLDDTLIRLAYGNVTTPSYVFPVTYDLACPALELAESLLPGGLNGILALGAALPASLAVFTNLTAMGGGSD